MTAQDEMPTVNQTCCVCGGSAPAFAQWFNRDTGFGLCGRCATWLKARPDYDPQEFRRNYGDPGTHWIPEDPFISGLEAFHGWR